MSSFEDNKNRNDINSKIDPGDFETQQIHSQYSGGDLEGDRINELQYFTNTMHVDDSYLSEDAFETQDLGEATQVLDELDCMKNMPIELLNEFYTENVAVRKCYREDKSHAFCETQVISQDDDSEKSNDGNLVGPENAVDSCPPRQGSFSGGFTSIRAASVRASGLAAREHGASHSSDPTTSEKSSVEQQTSTENDQECLQKGIINSNICKVDSATARKLFKDDEVSEIGEQSATQVNDTDDSLDTSSQNCIAGLSYANSLEPDELSQSHALEVVDKFIDNIMDFDGSFGMVGKIAEKSKVVSGVKGSRELAKKTSDSKKTDGECGIYDWDDSREDDCGGDFFMKKKELFYDNGRPKQRCLTEPRNCNGDENKKQKYFKNILKGSAYSDSGLLLRKLRANGKSSLNRGEKVFQKNLIKDLDEQVYKLNSVEKGKNDDIIETNDVGPDTQSAAEAIETLCFEVHLADDNVTNADKAEATRKNKLSPVTARSEKCSTKKSPHHSNVGVVTRQAKQIKRARISPSNDHVAHRTRKCTKLIRSKASDNSFDRRDETDHVISVGVTRKRDKFVGSNGSSATEIDAVDSNNLQRKRYRQENLTSAQYNNGRLKISRKVGANSEASPPAVRRTPVNNGSPICMGDEYRTQSCRKNLSRLSLVTKINNTVSGSPESNSGMKESRKRKNISNIRVLFSQHLDEDVVKKQKKILSKLGGADAAVMSDATHFVADEFIRTRNMLEAIACGKPVVTRLWLESCGQASCLIDEKNFILRDSKKEREFGFCLPVSLSRACQYPLLQGQKVFVTPNTKPGKETLVNLIKAVHGLAIERVGRSVLNHAKLSDDLLIISCVEDYDICVPFLEKGGTIYSSELLLNGIVKQKLEFERHRLFDDHVKRTRSTIWMKKKNVYFPVRKCS